MAKQLTLDYTDQIDWECDETQADIAAEMQSVCDYVRELGGTAEWDINEDHCTAGVVIDGLSEPLMWLIKHVRDTEPQVQVG